VIRRRAVASVVVALLASVGVASAATSTLRASLLTQGSPVPPGGAWAYYVRVSHNGKPWQGIAEVAVRRPKGALVDDVGRFPIDGSLLRSYVWNTTDKGLYDFDVTLTQNGKTLKTLATVVHIRRS